jgi:hypothetical protein
VRNALVYVLNNFRKHVATARGMDPCSSAASFDGWKRPSTPLPRSPLPRARTWLAAVGWRLRGLLDVDEGPRGHRRVAR